MLIAVDVAQLLSLALSAPVPAKYGTNRKYRMPVLNVNRQQRTSPISGVAGAALIAVILGNCVTSTPDLTHLQALLNRDKQSLIEKKLFRTTLTPRTLYLRLHLPHLK